MTSACNMLAASSFLLTLAVLIPARTDYRIISGDIMRERDRDHDRAYAREYRKNNPEKVKAANKAWRTKYPERMKALRSKWFAEHPDERRAYMKAYKAKTYSKRYHGVDRAAYLAMCEQQHHLCGICQRKRKLVVDHCHATNYVRGLLCRSCNTALGLLNDNCDLFRRAISYLEMPSRLVSHGALGASADASALFPSQGSSQSEMVLQPPS